MESFPFLCFQFLRMKSWWLSLKGGRLKYPDGSEDIEDEDIRGDELKRNTNWMCFTVDILCVCVCGSTDWTNGPTICSWIIIVEIITEMNKSQKVHSILHLYLCI